MHGGKGTETLTAGKFRHMRLKAPSLPPSLPPYLLV